MPIPVKQWGNEASAFFLTQGKAGQARLLRDWIDLGKYSYEMPRHRPKAIKPLKNGLFELKTKNTAQNLEYRSLFVFQPAEIVILLCFVKKARKTDPSHIAKARHRHAALNQGEIANELDTIN